MNGTLGIIYGLEVSASYLPISSIWLRQQASQRFPPPSKSQNVRREGAFGAGRVSQERAPTFLLKEGTMGFSLSWLHGEIVVMSEMTSGFLCLNFCILIPYSATRTPQAIYFFIYTHRIRPSESKFESSELHQNHLGIRSLKIQIPGPTPLRWASS